MTLAWLLLLTGLTISAVAIYYSVVGLTAIFSAAAIPIIIMGSALEVGKLVCASWLKANWERAPRFMKYYMIIAVIVLMLITSMGIFGFLSKAHNDQNIVSGDVQSKIAIYDEKIKTEKDNIESAKKALAQMDAQVDQMLGRTDTDRGAERAVQIRRNQAKERASLQAEITKAQKSITELQAERAPIAAEVRKVEAEVGPIKYIAKFIYGDKGADENMLEKAVTWIIILIVIVFDPLAVIMLLAAQMTFGWYRRQEPAYEPDDGPLTKNQIEQIQEEAKVRNFDWPLASSLWPFPSAREKTEPVLSETPSTALGGDITAPEEKAVDLEPDFLKQAEERVQERIEDVKQEETPMPLEQWNKMIEEAEKAVEEEKKAQVEPDFPKAEEIEESKKKTYMTKDETGKIQINNRS
jgi:multidrug efflux pump subunit AcrA (membrane-fusion protein)